MAVVADKNPPENTSYSERIVDFSGGLNTTISGSLLNSNEAQVATDISMEQKGTIRPRRGRTKRYNTPFSSEPVTGLGVYYKNDGTSRILTSSGESLYSDAPHMSTRWDVKADWEHEGEVLDGLASTTQVEGSVTCRKQAFGEAAVTADALLWTALNSTLSVKENDSHYIGGDSVEVLINATKTDGYAYKSLTIDTSKYVMVTAYVKNHDATTGIRLIGLTSGNTVSKGSSYVTGTGWTRVTLKLSPTDALLISSFGVDVTGVAGQYAYFCGLFYEYITEADYNNAGYVPRELTYFIPFERTFTFNDASTFGTGSLTHAEVSAGVLQLSVETAEVTLSQTLQEDFALGTNSGTSTSELINSVVLARQA